MESPPKIRTLEKDDLGALFSLYAHLHPNDDAFPDQKRIDQVWATILTSDSLFCLGMFVHERLVSTCKLALIPNLTRGCRPYGLIENVVTHPDFRRQGYGTCILKHALHMAWSGDCYKVMLLTGRKDEGIYRFYESIGFDRFSKQAFVVKPSGG